MSTFFQKLFGNNHENNKSNSQKHKGPQKRRLHFEPLESREMLSINPLEFSESPTLYADLTPTAGLEFAGVDLVASVSPLAASAAGMDGGVMTNTGPLGGGTNVTNTVSRDWVTVYSYVKDYELIAEIQKKTRWYDGISGVLSVGFPAGVSSDIGSIITLIWDRVQPRANDTIKGSITSVEDVTLTHNRNYTIGSAYVAGIGNIDGKMVPGSIGVATLHNFGVINNTFVDQYGIVNNRNDAKITTALVYDGQLNNSEQAKITEAYVLGGILQNDGGNEQGYSTPTIENLLINGGKVVNQGEAHIDTAFLFDGTINNSGTISTLVYMDGTYSRSGTGSINTLQIAANANIVVETTSSWNGSATTYSYVTLFGISSISDQNLSNINSFQIVVGNGTRVDVVVNGVLNSDWILTTTGLIYNPLPDPGDMIATARTASFANNTFSTTQRIGDGSYGARDVDMYAITVTASDVGRTYTFGTSLPSGGTSVDTYIRLFNVSGTQLAYNDDGGAGLYSRLVWIPPAAGTYYLGVSSYSTRSYNPNIAGSGSAGTTGDYTLTITRQAASVVVANINNSGAGSLRQAIADCPAGGMITFAESLRGKTIRLTGTQLSISKDITINASGMNITINANRQSRVFNITGGTVTLAGLKITGGDTGGDTAKGGGILNTGGTVTVMGCTITESRASGTGGGICNTSGTMTVINSYITGNTVTRLGRVCTNHNRVFRQTTGANRQFGNQSKQPSLFPKVLFWGK